MLLSTAHTMAEVSTGKRDGRGQIIKRAEIIHHYNQNMGAVDSFDQMLSYSCFPNEKFEMVEKGFFPHLQHGNSELLYYIQELVLRTPENTKTSKGLLRRIRKTADIQCAPAAESGTAHWQAVTSLQQPCSTHREAFPKEAAGNWT